VTCDHHDLPLVCGECGRPRWVETEYLEVMPLPGNKGTVTFDHDAIVAHRFQPAHLMPDPEGIEGTWKIPCPEPLP